VVFPSFLLPAPNDKHPEAINANQSIGKTAANSSSKLLNIDLAQQQCAGIRTYRATVESGNNFSPSQTLKMKLFRITICFFQWPFSFGTVMLW
jgi:hypothetical protein